MVNALPQIVTMSLEGAGKLCVNKPDIVNAVVSLLIVKPRTSLPGAKIGKHLNLAVDDVSTDSLVRFGYVPFEKKHAEKMKSFSLRHIANTEGLTVVHCQAGVSRSTAATAGIAAFLGADPDEAILYAVEAQKRSFTEFEDFESENDKLYLRPFWPNPRIMATISEVAYNNRTLLEAYFKWVKNEGRDVSESEMEWLKNPVF